ncbi:alpha/beta fold hydrolase [Mucilaginibacter jinjuensis]|uniref:Alpha/beta hydrolase n=1 Tax=Mucilaginibacter jinjuensis TaxID=1176721 RepID=A0ABY7T3J5_9SPHI|nr:alpha/beta hydrolase [Mucilaginibacter jinjuensis]WCT10765.1 alpha/beta hydrolase [Mucilaginibacter jinjuensis]
MKIFKVIAVTILFLLVSVSILIGALYIFKDKEKKELTDADRKKAGGEYIKLSKGITHYQIAGPDTGKTIILIHGFSVPYYIWDGTFEYLVSQGFRVVRYDMYGRGFSDRPYITYRKDVYIDQLTELISALKLRTPLSIAGISFGGGVTTDFTCLHPELVDKVILIDPTYKDKRPNVPQFVTIFEEAITPDDRAMGQLSDFKYPQNHPDWVDKYKVQMEYKNFRWALASTEYNYHYNAPESNACLNTKHKPVLLIWGKEDHTVPFKYSDSIRSVLKTDFFPVPDAGHLPSIEKADTVNAKILAFLRQ